MYAGNGLGSPGLICSLNVARLVDTIPPLAGAA